MDLNGLFFRRRPYGVRSIFLPSRHALAIDAAQADERRVREAAAERESLTSWFHQLDHLFRDERSA